MKTVGLKKKGRGRSALKQNEKYDPWVIHFYLLEIFMVFYVCLHLMDIMPLRTTKETVDSW